MLIFESGEFVPERVRLRVYENGEWFCSVDGGTVSLGVSARILLKHPFETSRREGRGST